MSASEATPTEPVSTAGAVEKPKRVCTPEQLEHLNAIRAKALEARKRLAFERKKQEADKSLSQLTHTGVTRQKATVTVAESSESSDTDSESDISSTSSESSRSPSPPPRRMKELAMRKKRGGNQHLQQQVQELERRLMKMHYKAKYKRPRVAEAVAPAVTPAVTPAVPQVVPQEKTPHSKLEFPSPLSRLF